MTSDRPGCQIGSDRLPSVRDVTRGRRFGRTCPRYGRSLCMRLKWGRIAWTRAVSKNQSSAPSAYAVTSSLSTMTSLGRDTPPMLGKSLVTKFPTIFSCALWGTQKPRFLHSSQTMTSSLSIMTSLGRETPPTLGNTMVTSPAEIFPCSARLGEKRVNTIRYGLPRHFFPNLPNVSPLGRETPPTCPDLSPSFPAHLSAIFGATGVFDKNRDFCYFVNFPQMTSETRSQTSRHVRKPTRVSKFDI